MTKKADELEELRREFDRCFDQQIFLQYNVGQLLGWVECQEWLHSKRKGKTPKLAEVLERLKYLLATSSSEDICLDNLKNLYFCTRKKGHHGDHRDEMGFSWPLLPETP